MLMLKRLSPSSPALVRGDLPRIRVGQAPAAGTGLPFRRYRCSRPSRVAANNPDWA
jgi:hypothetical protein